MSVFLGAPHRTYMSAFTTMTNDGSKLAFLFSDGNILNWSSPKYFDSTPRSPFLPVALFCFDLTSSFF